MFLLYNPILVAFTGISQQHSGLQHGVFQLQQEGIPVEFKLLFYLQKARLIFIGTNILLF